MNNVAKEMEHLHTLAGHNQDKRFLQLWDHMISEQWLTQAWEEIRKNQGSQTPGIDRRTAEDVDPKRIRHLSGRLRDSTYRPQPVRRVYIPKSNGKLRPLGIPTIEDRLVQPALRMVLEPIFEADFLPCSHGFRQGHSPHTALRDVARMYPRVSWVIEGDIVGCFDNIPHHGLLKAVARRIADGKVLSLVSAFLTAGYLENWQYHTTYSGTPQGGILSPLLCNIFLHQLDTYMEQLGANSIQTTQEKAARKNPAYDSMSGRIKRTAQQLRDAPTRADRTAALTKLLALKRKRQEIPFYDTRHQTKLGYIRYADDFVILVNGTQEEAREIKH